MFRHFGKFIAVYTSILLVVFVLFYLAHPTMFLRVWYGSAELVATVALLAIAPAVWLSGWRPDLVLTDRASDKQAPQHSGTGPLREPKLMEPTWSRVLSVWWLVTWRWLAMVLPCATATSFLSRMLEADLGTMFPINLLLGQVLMIVAFRMAIRKRYREFRIVLVPIEADLILDNPIT